MAEDFDSLVKLLRRTTDEFGWLQPLLDDPDSAAVLGAQIEIFARLGPAVDHNGAQATISDASGGQPGTSVITASRAASGTSGTLPAGYGFVDQRGVKAASTLAVAVGGGATTITIPVATLRQTELVNTEDDPLFAVDPLSNVIPDGSGGILFIPASLVLAAVRVVATTNQGLTGFPTIDGVTVGNLDRILLTGQTDATQNGVWTAAAGAWSRAADLATSADVRARLAVPVTEGSTHAGQLWQLASPGPYVIDTTPLTFVHVGLTATVFLTIGPSDPIQGAAADYLSVHGSERGLLRQPNETTAAYRQRIRNIPDVVSPIAVAQSTQQAAQSLGLPPIMILEPFQDGATPALKALYGLGSFEALCFDDPDSFLDDPTGGLVAFDRRIATAYFEVLLTDFVSDPNQVIMFLDDGAYLDDPVLGYPEALASLPAGVAAALFALINDIQAKKAAGVNFDLFLKDLTDEVGVGATSSAGYTLVWTLTPPGGKIWTVQEFEAGHSSPNPSPGTIAHHVVFNLEGGGTLTSPNDFALWTNRITPPSVRVTSIQGFAKSDGSIVATLVGHGAVLEETV